MAVDSVNNINNAYLSQNQKYANMTVPMGGANNYQSSSVNSGSKMSGCGANVCVSPAGDVLEKRALESPSLKVDEKVGKDGFKVVTKTDVNTGFVVDEKAYSPDGKLKVKRYFNPENGKSVKNILYYDNGKKSAEFFADPNTGKLTKSISYQADGCTKHMVTMFDKETGNSSKLMVYEKDGYSPAMVMKYNPVTQKPLHVIYYDGKGRRDSASKFNPQTGQEEKRIQFDKNGEVNSVSAIGPEGPEVYKQKVQDNKKVD